MTQKNHHHANDLHCSVMMTTTTTTTGDDAGSLIITQQPVKTPESDSKVNEWRRVICMADMNGVVVFVVGVAALLVTSLAVQAF